MGPILPWAECDPAALCRPHGAGTIGVFSPVREARARTRIWSWTHSIWKRGTSVHSCRQRWGFQAGPGPCRQGPYPEQGAGPLRKSWPGCVPHPPSIAEPQVPEPSMPLAPPSTARTVAPSQLVPGRLGVNASHGDFRLSPGNIYTFRKCRVRTRSSWQAFAPRAAAGRGGEGAEGSAGHSLSSAGFGAGAGSST